MKEKERVVFGTTKCFLNIFNCDGDIEIDLYAVRGKRFIASATVELPVSIPPGHAAIKNYSESSGMLQALMDAKIVAEPSFYVRSGYVEIPVCRVLAKVVNYDE